MHDTKVLKETWLWTSKCVMKDIELIRKSSKWDQNHLVKTSEWRQDWPRIYKIKWKSHANKGMIKIIHSHKLRWLKKIKEVQIIENQVDHNRKLWSTLESS